MSINAIIQEVEAPSIREERLEFEVGDTVEVHVRILEGDKERIQPFTGIVIGRRGSGTRENFTVRKVVEGEGVERIFPINSPRIAKVVVTRKAKVRRAKLYFLRDRIGKKAVRLKERPMNAPVESGVKKPSRKGRKAKESANAEASAASKKAASAKKEKRKAARGKKKAPTS